MGCRSDGYSDKRKINTEAQRFSLSVYVVARCFLLQFFSSGTHSGIAAVWKELHPKNSSVKPLPES